MPATRSTFKGNKTISLTANETDRYPFSFGLVKAKLIVDNLDAIRAFVDDNQAPMVDATDRQYEDQCQQATGA